MIATTESHVPKLLLSLDGAATALSVCPRTISRLIARGELHAIRIGNRGIRISTDELRKWIAKQQEANGD